MKKNNELTEVLTPEVEVMDLESSINTALIRANITDQVIVALKEKYGGMVLKSIDDKQSYLEIKESKREVAKIRIIAEKITKRGREEAIRVQRLWLAKEKDVVGRIDEVESHLAGEIKKFDDEVERKELEEQKRQEAVYMNRQAILLKYGAQYNNGSFELNHISYEISLIKEADEEQWNDTILPKYKKVYEEIESARVAEENKRKEELEQQKKEREQFEAQQKKFKEDQELFAKQQKELQDAKDAHEREQRLDQEHKYNEEKQKKQTVINDRVNQLRTLGLNYSAQYDSYVFEDIAISRVIEIEGRDNKEWDDLILRITPGIEKNKKELKEKRIAQFEKEKQEAIELAAQQEREKIAVEQRLAELEKQKEVIRKQQELEAAKDKEKYAAVVEYFKHYPNLAMTSNFYKGKMNEINDFINDL